jgi:hypothetical protein
MSSRQGQKWKKQPEVGNEGGGTRRSVSVFYQKDMYFFNHWLFLQTFSCAD